MGFVILRWDERPDKRITLTIEDADTKKPLAHAIYTRDELREIAKKILEFTLEEEHKEILK